MLKVQTLYLSCFLSGNTETTTTQHKPNESKMEERNVSVTIKRTCARLILSLAVGVHNVKETSGHLLSFILNASYTIHNMFVYCVQCPNAHVRYCECMCIIHALIPCVMKKSSGLCSKVFYSVVCAVYDKRQ